MKRFLSLFLSLVMLLSIAGLDLSAYANTSGDFEYEVLDDGTAEITGYNGSAAELTIPLTLDGYTVTSICEAPFYGPFDDCQSLAKFIVDEKNPYFSSQDGVLFNKNKTELIVYPIGNTRTSYIIPNSVTKICNYAFYNCKSLRSVKMENSVTRIGRSAFTHCTALTSVTISNTLDYIGDYVFYDCNSLISITIPDSVTSIYCYTFCLCKSLTSVTIPDSVIYIGDCAFTCCDNLKDVYYTGSEAQWNNISIDYYFNECLANATIHYNNGLIIDKDEPEKSTEPTQPEQPTVPIQTGNSQPTVPTQPITQPTTQPSTTAAPSTTKVSKPKSAKLSKLTKGKKQFKVSWKKVGSVTGYQIQYSTSKKFAKKTTKSVTVKGAKKTSATVKKLKSKKKYYVRMRTYKTVNGEKVYSSWSKAKTVTTK